MYNDDNKQDDRDTRARRMRMEQDEMILSSDISALKRKIEDDQLDTRVLQKKADDIRAQIEEAERRVKKSEDDLRLKEEDMKTLRKKMQGNS